MPDPVIDKFKIDINGRDATFPARHFEVVVPSDTVDFSELARGILVGDVGGIMMLVENSGTAVAIPVTPYQWIPFRARRVNLTGTTVGISLIWYA